MNLTEENYKTSWLPYRPISVKSVTILFSATTILSAVFQPIK